MSPGARDISHIMLCFAANNCYYNSNNDFVCQNKLFSTSI